MYLFPVLPLVNCFDTSAKVIRALRGTRKRQWHGDGQFKIYDAVLDLIYVSGCKSKTLDLWALAV